MEEGERVVVGVTMLDNEECHFFLEIPLGLNMD